MPGSFIFMDNVAAGGAVESTLGFGVGGGGCFFVFGGDGNLDGVQGSAHFFAPAVVDDAAAGALTEGFFS